MIIQINYTTRYTNLVYIVLIYNFDILRQNNFAYKYQINYQINALTAV